MTFSSLSSSMSTPFRVHFILLINLLDIGGKFFHLCYICKFFFEGGAHKIISHYFEHCLGLSGE